jgi:hypothetical protein
MKRKTLVLAVALAVPGLMAMGSAKADTEFNFSGFGTVGVTHSSSQEADFNSSLFAPNGVGKTRSTGLSSDTRLGGQAAANFGNGLSGVLQVVSDIRSDNSYQPKFEWANLKYDVTKDTHVRIGRVVPSMFMISEYRNVGYALTPARTPWDVYSQNPLTHLDGANAGTRFNVAEGILSLEGTVGHVRDTLNGAKMTGFGQSGDLVYENGSSTFNLAYAKFNVNMGLDSISMYQTQLVAPYGALVGYPTANIQSNDLRGHFIDLGYTFDPGSWIVQAEYVQRKSEAPLVPSSNTWYALAGYRIGKFTPYASYSKVTTKLQSATYAPAQVPAALQSAFYGCLATPGMSLATCNMAIPQYMPMATIVGEINGIDHMILATRYDQNTVSLGVRYDFYKNLALKAQYDHISKPANSVGEFVTPPGGFLSSWNDYSKTVNILTVNLDFVF